MSRNTIASIDLAAIRHNLKVVRGLAPDSQVASVVKADGYGHGLARVAGALGDSDLLAVATSGEAAALRNGGWSGRLLMLEGFANADEFELARFLNAETVVHHRSQLDMLKQRQWTYGNRVWLKLDTGMHRLGFPLHETQAVYAELEAIAGPGAVSLMSHFACADEAGNPKTGLQIERFDEAVEGLQAEHSLANSAAILNFPAAHRDMVRPGILLYGISSDPSQPASDIGLRPAMTLSCELVAINQCRKGEGIGYGAAYHCPEDMRIGVAAIGYGDGYPRHLKNGTPVLVNGREAKLAGRVSMDLITIDLRGHDDATTGDRVVLWGEGLPVETVAPWADSVVYELICGVTGRVPRIAA
jgi:alanine racemase